MVAICSNVDEKILNEFRDAIYQNSRLRRGDFKKSLEIAMIEYAIKYSNSKSKKSALIEKMYLKTLKKKV